MNTYEVSYIDNMVSGTTAMTTINAKQFTFTGSFVVFSDNNGQNVFAVPTERNPIILLTGSNS